MRYKCTKFMLILVYWGFISLSLTAYIVLPKSPLSYFLVAASMICSVFSTNKFVELDNYK